jgi:hypothetical protein
VIGANTPAMIRSMTREVESRNLIVASMYLHTKHSHTKHLHTKHLRTKAHTPRQLAVAFAPS